MDKDQKVRLDYASKYAGLANYWKNRAGMIDALKQHKTVDSKRKTETAFTKWAQDPSRKAKYGDIVEIINNYYSKTNENARHNNYLMTVLRSSTFAGLPANLGRTLEQYANENEAKRAEMRPAIEDMINNVFEGVHLGLEEEVLAAQLNLYYTKAAKGGLAPYVKQIGEQSKGDFRNYVKTAFNNSIFTKKEELLKYLDNPVASKITDDELYKLSTDLMTRYRAETPEDKALKDSYSKAFRLLVEGLRESGLSPIEYPDANSTLRLTYGKVVDLP